MYDIIFDLINKGVRVDILYSPEHNHTTFSTCRRFVQALEDLGYNVVAVITSGMHFPNANSLRIYVENAKVDFMMYTGW